MLGPYKQRVTLPYMHSFLGQLYTITLFDPATSVHQLVYTELPLVEASVEASVEPSVELIYLFLT